MNDLDNYKLAAPPDYEFEEEITQCELCELPATEMVDLSPYDNPGKYIANLCKQCAMFERKRIKEECSH